jgi:hypothetical protein
LAACTTVSTSEVPAWMVCSIEGRAEMTSYALRKGEEKRGDKE